MVRWIFWQFLLRIIKKSLHSEDIQFINRATQKTEILPDEKLNHIIEKYVSNIADIDTMFLSKLKAEFNTYEAPPSKEDEKSKKAQIILTKLNDIVEDGKINDTKLNEFIGKIRQ